jgi:hypothetical protein
MISLSPKLGGPKERKSDWRDSGLEIFDGVEHATLKPPPREFGEEAFHGEPGCRSGREVKCPARMPGKPCAHLRMFVDGVVIDDGVDGLSLRHLRLDGIEEADELLMAVALHAMANDGAVEHVESGEQRSGAVPFIVVGHGTDAAGLHRQARLRAIKRLDLALFVDREHHRMLGRVYVETHNVLEFVRKLRIVRQLERADAMRGRVDEPPHP